MRALIKNTVPLKVNVPPEKLESYKKLIYNKMYRECPETAPIVKLMSKKRKTPLSKLLYELREKGITPSIEGMKNIAHWCDIPYTE